MPSLLYCRPYWALLLTLALGVSMQLGGCAADGRALPLANDVGTAVDTIAADQTMPPAGCAALRNENCFHGAAFAECEGPTDPAIYCGEGKGCLWVSNGCPLPDRPVPFDEACGLGSLPYSTEAPAMMRGFVMSWGSEPWDRSREMNLTITTPHPEIGGTASVACENCMSDACEMGDTPCTLTPPSYHVDHPGTYVLRFGYGGLWGWYLLLEIDAQASPPRARLCAIPFSDHLVCKPGLVQCAQIGLVRLREAPGTSSELHGDFVADMIGDLGSLHGTF